MKNPIQQSTTLQRQNPTQASGTPGNQVGQLTGMGMVSPTANVAKRTVARQQKKRHGLDHWPSRGSGGRGGRSVRGER